LGTQESFWASIRATTTDYLTDDDGGTSLITGNVPPRLLDRKAKAKLIEAAQSSKPGTPKAAISHY
jgi:hypothetical protein